MSLLNYIKQIWDTTSYFNPTRMNHIEDGIYAVSDKVDNLNADDIAYSSGVSAKDKIDTVNSKIQKKDFLNTSSLTFNNIPQTCRGFLHLRGYSGNSQTNWTLTPFIVEAGSPAFDTPLNIGSSNRIPSSVSYSNGTLTFSLSSSMNNFALLIFTD